MTALLRAFAAMAFAVFMATAWTTPSAAHVGPDGHASAAAQSQPADAGAKAGGADATAPDCWKNGGQAGETTACCGHACHAAMAHDLPLIGLLPIEATVAPASCGPPALAGPSVHIKRPPRPLAATVG